VRSDGQTGNEQQQNEVKGGRSFHVLSINSAGNFASQNYGTVQFEVYRT
jgi:hypothetical protein